MMGSSTFNRIFRYFLRIFKMLLSLNKNCRAQTADTPCPITVAMAAPLTPMWNTLINSASRKMFKTAPIRTVHMPIPANPWVVI